MYGAYVETIPSLPIYGPRYFTGGEDGVWQQDVVGYTAPQSIPHFSPVGQDYANTGRVNVTDPDSSGFTYQVIQGPFFGSGTVDAAGNWQYVGLRPAGYSVGDANQDGQTDYISWTG
jgi:hypothetical protein